MSLTGLKPFDSTVHTTNAWLNELMEELGWEDRHCAYHAMRAVLQSLRDQLGVEEAAALGAQLPMLVRGFYYEGWRPANASVRKPRQQEFLARIAEAFPHAPDVDPEEVVRGVFRVLTRHVSGGEIEGMKRLLPRDLRELWS